MARETHPPPSSRAARGALPGRGHRKARALPLRGNPTIGAAAEAPTAPHATYPAPGAAIPGGPARFWDARRLRLVFGLGIALSIVFHGMVMPWGGFSFGGDVSLAEVAGEVAIPVDLLGEEAPPPPPPPPPPTEPEAPPAADPEGAGAAAKKDAGAPPKPKPKPVPEAGAPEALASDAGVPSEPSDAGGLEPAEGGVPDGGGLVASADAGATPGSPTPIDPAAALGAKNVAAAGEINITLLLSFARMRQHPLAPRISTILQTQPQWRDFLRGAPAGLDPMRDVDQVQIYGPSLIHTEKTLVVVRYNIPDAVVDGALESMSKAGDKGGGTFDVKVPGVKGWLAHADQADRVLMRLRKGVVVIVPKADAVRLAKDLSRAGLPARLLTSEAVLLVVKDPGKQIRGLGLPPTLQSLRLVVVPDAQGGADVIADGACSDEAAAVEVARAVTETIARRNNFFVQNATDHLLDGATAVPDGKTVKLQIHASAAQIDKLVTVAETVLGIPPPGGARP